MKKILFSVTAAIALGGTAMAGGDIVPVVPADSWSGFYVGAQAGYIWGDADVTIDTSPAWYVNGLNVDGLLGGVFAGFNWRLQDDWLVGLEAGVNWISNDDEKLFYTMSSTGKKYYFEVKQDWEASIVGRIGKVFDETYMPYVLAGVSWTKLEGRTKRRHLGVTTTTKWISDTVTGLTVGLGVEYKFTENFHGRLEYRYNNYRNADLSAPYADSHIDYNSNVITAGIVYRF